MDYGWLVRTVLEGKESLNKEVGARAGCQGLIEGDTGPP